MTALAPRRWRLKFACFRPVALPRPAPQDSMTFPVDAGHLMQHAYGRSPPEQLLTILTAVDNPQRIRPEQRSMDHRRGVIPHQMMRLRLVVSLKYCQIGHCAHGCHHHQAKQTHFDFNRSEIEVESATLAIGALWWYLRYVYI